MQNLYSEVSTLDRRCVERHALSEEVMMEHAGAAIERFIRDRFAPGSSILIVCGNGNNGADGLVSARLLHGSYRVEYFMPTEAKSSLCRIQLARLDTIGLSSTSPEREYDVIVDALFGSGLSRSIHSEIGHLLDRLNEMDGYKIACDVPSGLYADGTLDPHCFIAETTITMGALKRGMFSDAAKTVCGEIFTADLGVPRTHYEIFASWKLLEKTDLRLPVRRNVSSHKGYYGHLAVVCGEKTGAAIIAGSAALRFGAGLVSLISNENVSLPYELMQSHSLPSSTTAIAAGMGLGTEFGDDELLNILDHSHPMVLDADIFYHPMFPDLLRRDRIVLTPHPKEFTQILRTTGIADIDVAALQNNRFAYTEAFCSAYPKAVLVLKGSNVIIGHGESFFVNPHGTVALAKGGSGDVLGGLIGSLLAQGYDPLEAAVQASLAHALAAEAFTKNNYSLTPSDLIERITVL